MHVFRVAAIFALLTGPVCAQTLIQSFDQKTPQQKADDELREKFSKEQQSHQQAPEPAPKTAVDAWGNVRTGDAGKTAASKTAAAKASTPKTKTVSSVKPSNKTGVDAN